jgi:hypothetical protein
MLYAGKRVENRTWNHIPTYRGPLLIHASKGFDADEFCESAEEIEAISGLAVPPFHMIPTGAIVAICELVRADHNGLAPTDLWALPGQIGIWLANVVPVDPPVPQRGELGLFEVKWPRAKAAV